MYSLELNVVVLPLASTSKWETYIIPRPTNHCPFLGRQWRLGTTQIQPTDLLLRCGNGQLREITQSMNVTTGENFSLPFDHGAIQPAHRLIFSLSMRPQKHPTSTRTHLLTFPFDHRNTQPAHKLILIWLSRTVCNHCCTIAHFYKIRNLSK